MLYSRAQLRLLLVLAAILLVGLGVREWRAGFPDTAGRLERFDHEEALPPLAASPRGEAGPSPDTPAKGSRASSFSRLEAREAPPPIADPRPLDLNRATVAELARLPGVGPGLAQRILEERERRGRFDSPDALRQIMGVGPKKLAALRDLVTVGE
jgi:competence ComEA-like helix-hairpin-helix protein